MKTIPFLLLIVFLGSCSSKEATAGRIAQSYVKSTLYYPESYESVFTKIDSAYTTVYTDDIIVNAVEKLRGLKIEEVESSKTLLIQEYNSAKSSVALWSDAYTAYSREQYRQAKEEMAEISQKLDEKTVKQVK